MDLCFYFDKKFVYKITTYKEEKKVNELFLKSVKKIFKKTSELLEYLKEYSCAVLHDNVLQNVSIEELALEYQEEILESYPEIYSECSNYFRIRALEEYSYQ